MSVIDVDKISDLIRECAAEHIVPRYQSLAKGDILTKTSPTDLVTQADIQAEAHLERILPDLYHGSLMIGEEGVSRGDHSLEALSQDERGVFVVDPVDGTSNFVHGRPEFGLMIAYVYQGRVEHSWIYDILQDDMYVAEHGAGSYCEGVKLSVSAARDPAQMIGHINTKFFPKDLQPLIDERKALFGSCQSLGAAAHEYTRVAKGQSDVVVYSRLKPWDHLPGSLLVREAGGVVRKWNGGEYEVSDHYAGLIVTNSTESWEAIFAEMFDGVDLEPYLKSGQGA